MSSVWNLTVHRSPKYQLSQWWHQLPGQIIIAAAPLPQSLPLQITGSVCFQLYFIVFRSSFFFSSGNTDWFVIWPGNIVPLPLNHTWPLHTKCPSRMSCTSNWAGGHGQQWEKKFLSQWWPFCTTEFQNHPQFPGFKASLHHVLNSSVWNGSPSVGMGHPFLPRFWAHGGKGWFPLPGACWTDIAWGPESL